MPPATNQKPDDLPRWVWYSIAALTGTAFFLGLNMALIGPDEPRYAQVGREMFLSGDLITPRLGGFHWFEKPPLLYWLEAFFYNIFGVSEFAARLGPALCGLGTVAAIWTLFRYGLADRGFARWAAAIAASTLGIIVFSHGATTDVIVTFPLTVAITAFFIYDREEARGGSYRWLLLIMYVAAGVALLAKGLIGLIFPPAIIGLYLIASRRLPSARLLTSLIWGLPITLGIAATWYVPMYLRYGDEFIREFIIRQHFERFATNDFQHPQRFYFYLLVLPLMTLPWLPLFARGVWNGVRSVAKVEEANDTRAAYVLGIVWLAFPLVFFSAASSKLPGYILPAVPPAILLASLVARDLIAQSERWRLAILGLAAATLAVVTILLPTVVPYFADRESVREMFREADARGYSQEPVLILHAFNYNAEYYAAGRLQRDRDGKQVKLDGPGEVRDQMHLMNRRTVLVLVTSEEVRQLTESPMFVGELIGSNKEFSLVGVTLR